VAGGIGFQYNLRVDGERVTDLRLSSGTVAGIFTRSITRWNDPAIHADNPGTQLPDIAIVPVVRSDAAATTAGLTHWLSAVQPTAWSAYCTAAGRGAGCGMTTRFPTVPGDVALAGSNGVTSYVAQAGNNGAITYAESSYALRTTAPMAKLLTPPGTTRLPPPGPWRSGSPRPRPTCPASPVSVPPIPTRIPGPIRFRSSAI
jgi:ABC-type phosphate transport system substrate-binding protein